MRVVPIVLVIALGATSAWLWRELNRERGERDILEVRLERQQDLPLVSDVQSDDLVADSPSARLPQAGPGGAQESGVISIDTRTFDPRSDPRLRKDPNYLAARERFYEAMLNDEYPDLARVLKIPDETATRLIELRATQQVRRFRVGLPMEAEGDQGLFKLERQQREYEADVEIAAMIGQAKLQQWKDYEASIPERLQVKRLRLELMDSGDPLVFEDGETLIRALYEIRLRLAEELKAMPVEGPSGDEDHPSAEVLGERLMRSDAESDRRTLKAAEKVLSPSQLEMFRRMLETQQEFQRAMTLMHHAQREALD